VTVAACAQAPTPRPAHRIGRLMSVAGTVWVAPSPCLPLPPAPRRMSSSWVVIFLLFALPAAAQEPTKDFGEASLEELANIQVYSASKHMQSASDAPSSVTVITADDIQKYGFRSLADILESVVVFTSPTTDYSFVGVRGFGRLGDWNPASCC